MTGIVAFALIAGLVGLGSRQVWQHHEKSLAIKDADAIARDFAAATASSPTECRASTTSATQFVGCFVVPYAPPAEFKAKIIRVFRAANVPVSGANCVPVFGAATNPQICDVWVTHGQWHARATFTSALRVPSPADLRRAIAAGTAAAKAIAAQPHQPWTGVVAVSRFA